MDYKILVSNDEKCLIKEVKEYLNDGWSLQGGVSLNGKYIVQAIIREKEA